MGEREWKNREEGWSGRNIEGRRENNLEEQEGLGRRVEWMEQGRREDITARMEEYKEIQ